MKKMTNDKYYKKNLEQETKLFLKLFYLKIK